jgi:hypothetical protein
MGTGDRHQLFGAGTLYIDDIGVGHPLSAGTTN